MTQEDELLQLVGIQYDTKSKEIAPERRGWAKAEMVLILHVSGKSNVHCCKNNIA